MTIREMRELLGITRSGFSKKYNIPLRTLENWESGVRKAPEYVLKLLERVVIEDYKSLSSDEKFAIKIDMGQTAQIDDPDLTEQQIIDNRFL